MLRTCFIVAVSTGVVLLAACGSDDDSEASTTDGGGGSAADAGNAAGTGGGGTSSGGSAGRGGTSSGGSAGGGGTPSPDASTGGASEDGAAPTSDGAAPVEAGSACDQLAACCTPGPFEASCQQIAAQGVDLQCSTVMGIFCMGGADGGFVPGEGGVGDCTGLQACCDQLSGIQQTQCEAIVGTGNDMNCSTVAFLYCP
jgi:hypothetical protein